MNCENVLNVINGSLYQWCENLNEQNDYLALANLINMCKQIKRDGLTKEFKFQDVSELKDLTSVYEFLKYQMSEAECKAFECLSDDSSNDEDNSSDDSYINDNNSIDVVTLSDNSDHNEDE